MTLIPRTPVRSACASPAALPRAVQVLAAAIALALAAALPASTAAFAQGAAAVKPVPPAPVIVDEETDTPYVPTPADVVDWMLKLAAVGPGDYLIDIGSGDGRIVLTAASKFGARGHGIEIDPRLVERSRASAKQMGIADRAQFRVEDLFEADFSKATVITVYLLPKVMQLITPKLAALRPGTRIISHDYAMLPEWRPDLTARLYVPDKPVGADKHSTLMLWTVPAAVGGRWSFDLPAAQGSGRVEVAVTQSYQVLTGKATLDGAPVELHGLRVDGERFRFALERIVGGKRQRHEFDGLVSGDRVAGSVLLAGQPAVRPAKWEARLAR